jgi:hypothetical protein
MKWKEDEYGVAERGSNLQRRRRREREVRGLDEEEKRRKKLRGV